MPRQAGFGGGIFRGRKAPADAVYDAVNMLVNDERDLFKRGGGGYLTTVDAGANIETLAALPMFPGSRVVMAYGSTLAAVNGTSPLAIQSGLDVLTAARPVAVGGFVAFPRLSRVGAILYGGTLKTADYITTAGASVSRTKDSNALAGAGTAFTANVDVGMLYVADVGQFVSVVAAVNSNTSITLADPSPVATAGEQGFFLRTQPVNILTTIALPGATTAMAAAGGRLFMGVGNRAYFSDPGPTYAFLVTNYHQLPQSAVIVGMEGLGETLLVFTTAGVWAISDLSLDPLDDVGNVQHRVEQISQDVLLWGERGIAGWSGRVLVPAIDDVYVLGRDGAALPVSSAIRPLYRGYVKAGYQPGFARVHRGHYFLPVLNGTTLVDVLVCRLDLADRNGMRPAWTRWAGHSAATAYVEQVGASVRRPKLYAAKGLRVLDLSDTLSVPGAAADADGTTPAFTVDTQDFDVGNGPIPSTVTDARIGYEMAGPSTPTVTVSWASGAEGSAFTAAAALRGGGVIADDDFGRWRIAKRRERMRLRIASADATTKFVLRWVELRTRLAGRA